MGTWPAEGLERPALGLAPDRSPCRFLDFLDGEPVSGSGCMAGYSPCLPVTDDLGCGDVRSLGKAPVVVTGSDPYHLDGDDDGYGCE